MAEENSLARYLQIVEGRYTKDPEVQQRAVLDRYVAPNARIGPDPEAVKRDATRYVTVTEPDGATWQLPLGRTASVPLPLRPSVLRALRKRAKLTQTRLAEILGVSRVTVARWEKDQQHIGRIGNAKIMGLLHLLAREKVRVTKRGPTARWEGLGPGDVGAILIRSKDSEGYPLILFAEVRRGLLFGEK